MLKLFYIFSLLTVLGGGLWFWQDIRRPTAETLEVIDTRAVEIDFTAVNQSNDTVTLISVRDPSLTVALPPPVPGGIAIADAVAIATEAHQDSIIQELLLNYEKGILVYRVDFIDRLRILIDAESGQILEINPRGEDDDERIQLEQGVASEFNMLEAIHLAAELYPDSLFEEAELEEEDGQLVYEIELDNGLAVYVDANTGAFLYTAPD